jgi:hypothetical protein
MYRKLLAISIMLLLVGCSQRSQKPITTTIPVVRPTAQNTIIDSPTPTPDTGVKTSTGIPVHIAMSIDRAPRLGETATISWTVRSDWEFPLLRAFLELPYGVQLVGGTANWQGSLPARGWQQLSATVKVVAQGVWDIRAVVRTGQEGGDSWSNVNHLYLTATTTESRIGLPSGDPRRVQVEQPEGGDAPVLEEQLDVKPQGESVAPEPPALEPTNVP